MTTTLRIAICEDDAADAERLEALIASSEISAEVSHFTSGEEFLASFWPGLFDLVILDIYLGSITGIEIATKIRETDKNVMLCFATSSPDHTRESYKLGALKYLDKPASFNEVKEALELALLKRGARPSLSLAVGGKTIQIALDEILFFEVSNHVVLVHTTDGIISSSQATRLDDIAKMVPEPPFLRCHHSFLVNLYHVARIDRDFVMSNGEVAQIRRSDIKLCQDAFKTFLIREVGGESQW